MKKTKETQKGITLIALVITIIVMLILAGVSIAMLTGDNGILTQATNAKLKNQLEEEREKIKLAWNAVRVLNEGAKATAEDIEEELEKNGETDVTATEADGKITIVMSNGNKYIIENGEVKAESEIQETYIITYSSTIGGSITPDGNIPTTIKTGETVRLAFRSYQYNDNPIIGIVVTGAEYTVHILQIDIVEVEIKNPTSDVNIIINIAECCFVPGTQVLMADKTTKNIEDIEIGDKVISYNEETKQYETDEVIALKTNPNTTDIARLNLIDNTSVEMNAYHPIYTQEGWKSLTGHEGLPILTENDKVLSKNGEFIDIYNIERWEEKEPIETYNLTIKKNHNFFVGNTPILVHNANCPT